MLQELLFLVEQNIIVRRLMHKFILTDASRIITKKSSFDS
jgi:hypothetical protein